MKHKIHEPPSQLINYYSTNPVIIILTFVTMTNSQTFVQNNVKVK